MRTRRHSAAFTLVELMVTVLLAAIVLTYGVPGYRTMVLNNRQTGQLNNFLSSLMLARSEAVKRKLPVTLCKSADGSRCTLNGGWEQGWMIYSDNNNNGVIEALEVIRAFPGFSGASTLRGTNSVRDTLVYQGTGFLVPGNSGLIVHCDSRTGDFAVDGSDARVLVIGATGHGRVVAGDDPAVANNGGVQSCLTP